MKWISILFFLMMTACKSAPINVSGLPIDEKTYKQQEEKIGPIEKQLSENKIYDAERNFRNFITNNAQSVFVLRAHLGLAKALEYQGRWLEAIEVYKQVLRTSQGTNRNIAALAMYNLSFCYESIGDHGMTLATLKDAENLKSDLPKEIAIAEIPARLAAHYFRIGLNKEAVKYFHQAESGVAIAYGKDDPKSQELKAMSFYQMGFMASGHISYENLQGHLDTVSMIQVFSMRSVEVEHPVWSLKALQGLKKNYEDIWNTVLNIPTRQGLDPGAAQKIKIDAQIKWAGQVLKTMGMLKQYENPEILTPEKVLSKELSDFMKHKEQEINSFLLAASDSTPLTPEAKKRQSIKREGVIESEPLFPSEKGQKGTKKQVPLNEEDPNLLPNSN